ncbi:oxygen-binding di-iron domain-containing protein [Pyrococcus yayanosii]|uniref:Metallo-beta-lactamase superfamily hydrolase n=1 Tax=Pyrococcus yayanosii (strain CH1 / JCM 16557) TaxID=529709 RepID=F8AJH3_PYRYC|nr:MBL fold metallo-hydrolase [Pyrococcus yayanosii]AEH25243.1 metallo-beta-lactamase superfamily hydrolase [Pyrococcus yayanosii CH1]
MGEYFIGPDLDPRKDHVLYKDDEHMVVYLGTQEGGEDVDVNTYLIVSNGKGIIIDPGGYKIFSKVLANASKYVDPQDIEYVYMCHQDPDVAGSIPLWREVSNAKIIIHWLWTRFLPHFGFENIRGIVHELSDDGESMKFGATTLEFIPAHFLHSPGHFTIYDRRSKFLFSGDIGIAFPEESYLVVENMERHIQAMRPIHERLMASNKAIKAWLSKVRHLDIEAILPQHGAIIPRKYIPRFFDFLENLKVGVDLL